MILRYDIRADVMPKEPGRLRNLRFLPEFILSMAEGVEIT